MGELSDAGVPRRADGKVNMTAPAPRLADGKPDLSGIWMTAEPNRGAGRGTQPPAKVPDEAGDQRTSPRRGRCGTSASTFLEGCRISPG